MTVKVAYYRSPIGWLEIRATEKGICSIDWVEEKGEENQRSPLLHKCKEQLREYFERSRHSFKIKLDIEGSEFQKRVWRELKKVHYGTTITYQELANRVGEGKGERAVGYANSRNPVNIIIPCHRVVGKNGKLVGYRGGLKRKKWLLDFEEAFEQQDLFSMMNI